MELTPLSPAPRAIWLFGLGSVLAGLTTLALARPAPAPIRYRIARPCAASTAGTAVRSASAPLQAPDASCRAESAPRWLHCQGYTCVIDRSGWQRAHSHLTPARPPRERIVPVVRSGRPSGVRVYAIPPCSNAYWLGLRSGDLLTRVNGLEISSLDRVVGAYAQLRTASHFTLDLERSGRPLTFDYALR